MILSNADILPGIVRWLEFSKNVAIDLGPSRELGAGLGLDLRAELQREQPLELASKLEGSPGLADACYALVAMLEDEVPVESTGLEVTRIYEFVDALDLGEEFGEKDWLLASLAVSGWRCARRFSTYAESTRWLELCSRHSRNQDHLRLFLDLESKGLSDSDELRDRFFSDTALLLTYVTDLVGAVNEKPTALRRPAIRLHSWLETHCETGDQEMWSYFLGHSALVIAWSYNYEGREDETRRWNRCARLFLGRTSDKDVSLTLVDFLELARCYAERRYQEVVSGIDSLLERMAALGMWDRHLRARFLKAMNLKEMASHEDALGLLSAIATDAVRHDDPTSAANALLTMAQIWGERGRSDEALQLVEEARPFVDRSTVPGCAAYFEGTVGELCRDAGDFPGALAAYRKAGQIYAETGILSLMAYMNVIIAETLLLVGDATLALETLLETIPIISREGLDSEADAALQLLIASIERQSCDPRYLAELCRTLRAMHRANDL